MSTVGRKRFLSILLEESDEVIVLSEMEHFQKTTMIGIDLDEYLERTYDDTWCDYVWQWAQNKEEAIAQHDAKVDAWHLNPDKETY